MNNRKSLVEAFLLDDLGPGDGDSSDVCKVTYRVPATLSRFTSPTLRQIKTAAVATQVESLEWLISWFRGFHNN